jgi:hypothetical protein
VVFHDAVFLADLLFGHVLRALVPLFLLSCTLVLLYLCLNPVWVCNLSIVKIMVDLSRCASVFDDGLPGASSVDQK